MVQKNYLHKLQLILYCCITFYFCKYNKFLFAFAQSAEGSIVLKQGAVVGVNSSIEIYSLHTSNYEILWCFFFFQVKNFSGDITNPSLFISRNSLCTASCWCITFCCKLFLNFIMKNIINAKKYFIATAKAFRME